MTAKTDRVVSRAIDWCQVHSDVAGLVIYGSAAEGRTHETSDVDLVVVTKAGRREYVWKDRARISAQLLDGDIAWSHELTWQGDYRYQAWRSDLLAIDLTLDEGEVQPHRVFKTGHPRVIAGELTLPTEPEHSREEPTDLAMETWVWFLGIHNQLQQGRVWDAYCQLIQLLDARLRPLTGDVALQALVPSAATAPETVLALRASVLAYQESRPPLEGAGAANTLATAVYEVVLAATLPYSGTH